MSSDTEALSIELPNGYVLQNYTITEVMGQGGFGITYLATEKDTERRVVIKENYPAEFSTRDRDSHRVAPAGTKNKENYDWALGSFLNEAKILTGLNHPNIVRVLAAFKALGTAYYVMDHIGGNPLHKAAPAPQHMTEEWLLGILRPMLSALGYIHSQPEVLLHRDIKPSNILVDPKGTPILIDFGAARSVISTHTHSKMGTPGYAPFEQWTNSKKCGPWTDLYALGATCYYLIVGEAPPDCHNRVPEETYERLTTRPELRGRFSPTLLASIDKALALHATNRWQSAREWMEEINTNHKEKLRRKQEEEHRRKAEEEQRAKAAEIARLLAEERARQQERQQREAALHAAEEKARQAEAERYAAEEKARQAEDARRAAEEKARQAEADRRAAEEKARQAEEKRNSSKIFVSLFKYSAIIAGILLAGWLTLGYTIGPDFASRNNYPTLLRSFLYLPKIDVNKADKKGDTPLIWAAYYGHTECVKQLIAAGADVNKADKEGRTPLYWAAHNGHKECVKLLIAAGADVNSVNKNGQSPLYWAETNQHPQIADMLIENGANRQQVTVTKLNEQGIRPGSYNTQLLQAAEKGNSNLLHRLIAAGADVNTTDQDGNTPLILAAINNHTSCVQTLLAAPNIGVNKTNKNGDTALYLAQKNKEIAALLTQAGADNKKMAKEKLAAQGINATSYNTKLLEAAIEGNAELLNLLITAGADVNTADKEGKTPLYRAARKGHTECVKLLLAAGADVNKASEHGSTPLHTAAWNGHTECVKLLITAGEDVNKADKEGYTPLYWAAENGHTECVKQLIAAGADVNKANKKGYTPLYWAAYWGHTECVKQLIAAKADVNKANEYGWTPLSQAAHRGHTECVKQLIAAGADVHMADKFGSTPFSWALNSDHTECAKLLIAAPGFDNSLYTPLSLAAMVNDVEKLLNLLSSANIDPNATGKSGDTPLYWAAYKGHTECVKHLIAAGADVNKADKYGQTPLYWAACSGHTECVKQLIAAGADVNMADKHGWTPLYRAAWNGHTECVKQLIAAGADVNKVNLNVAGTEEIKRLLRKAGAK